MRRTDHYDTANPGNGSIEISPPEQSGHLDSSSAETLLAYDVASGEKQTISASTAIWSDDLEAEVTAGALGGMKTPEPDYHSNPRENLRAWSSWNNCFEDSPAIGCRNRSRGMVWRLSVLTTQSAGIPSEPDNRLAGQWSNNRGYFRDSHVPPLVEPIGSGDNRHRAITRITGQFRPPDLTAYYGQYTEFLNAVAQTDTYSLYNPW